MSTGKILLLTNSDEDLNRKLRTKDIEIFVLGDGDGQCRMQR